ncbi:hypothetical protein GE21DRAFT_1134429 [Neurospora crassa]|nr:hypothetical protein GE21DRAFT_1134429 [Neurospora crassa]
MPVYRKRQRGATRWGEGDEKSMHQLTFDSPPACHCRCRCRYRCRQTHHRPAVCQTSLGNGTENQTWRRADRTHQVTHNPPKMDCQPPRTFRGLTRSLAPWSVLKRALQSPSKKRPKPRRDRPRVDDEADRIPPFADPTSAGEGCRSVDRPPVEPIQYTNFPCSYRLSGAALFMHLEVICTHGKMPSLPSRPRIGILRDVRGLPGIPAI